MAHGIESVAERVTAGKTASAAFALKRQQTQGQMRVTVTDDGRGIDPSVVSQAAISAGVLAESSLLDMGQSLRLISGPDFQLPTWFRHFRTRRRFGCSGNRGRAGRRRSQGVNPSPEQVRRLKFACL